ncbi:MAG: BolA family protein [Acidiferrobacter sp.]
MITPEDIKALIEAGLPDARVVVTGDGQHFEAIVRSGTFVGKSRVQQHRLVYATLGERMRAEIHALSLDTAAPE